MILFHHQVVMSGGEGLEPRSEAECRRLGAGALKTLGANKDAPLPVKLFEASDVILLDESSETGARNERRLVAVACAKEGSFEVIHGLLNRVMDVLGVPLLGGLLQETLPAIDTAVQRNVRE